MMFNPDDLTRADDKRLLILHPNPLQYEEALCRKVQSCLENEEDVAYYSNRPLSFLRLCRREIAMARPRTPASLVMPNGACVRTYRAPKVQEPNNSVRIRRRFDYNIIANASVVNAKWFRSFTTFTTVEHPDSTIIVSGRPDNILLAEECRASALDMAVFAGGYRLIANTN